ncbi:hypothetical protein ACLMJK_004312 [Lecanora helva]
MTLAEAIAQTNSKDTEELPNDQTQPITPVPPANPNNETSISAQPPNNYSCKTNMVKSPFEMWREEPQSHEQLALGQSTSRVGGEIDDFFKDVDKASKRQATQARENGPGS